MTCRFGKVTEEPQTRADEKPSEPMVQGNQADTTKCIADVLAAPVTQPISGTEQKLLGGLLRRLSHQHQSQFGLPVYTGGRTAHISFTPIGLLRIMSLYCAIPTVTIEHAMQTPRMMS